MWQVSTNEIISHSDYEKIVHGLKLIGQEIEESTFTFSRELEDIHMNIEARLSQLIGPVAGRLHTARSRNDQVAVDFRLWVCEETQKIAHALKKLIERLLIRAEQNVDAFIPGFIHLQTTQSVNLVII